MRDGGGGDPLLTTGITGGGQLGVPRRRYFWKVILGSVIVLALLGGGMLALYYRFVTTTPEYSLALIVHAAERHDQTELDGLIDTDAVVDSFLPQVLEKAAVLYGRGVDPVVIRKMADLAAPLMPSVKDRIRDKLPEMINRKAEPFKGVPVPIMAIGARRYLAISVQGDTATVRSKLPAESVEITMKKRGARWVVVSMRDENLAETIAAAAGQEIMAAATGGSAPDALIKDAKRINDLLNQAEKILNP